MTLVLSMIYIIVVPFYAHFALLHFMGLAADVKLPMGSFIWNIFSITVMPAASGFAIRAWRPAFALWIKPHIKLAATIVLFTSFGFILVDQLPVLRVNFAALFGITVAINLVTLAVVMASVRLMKFQRREAVAIGIEHLTRQEGTAIFIAVTIVGNNEISLPMIMNTPVALLVVLAFVSAARRLAPVGATVPAAA